MNVEGGQSQAKITHSRIGIMTYLVIKGPLADETSVSDFRSSIEECVSNNEIRVVLDLALVKKISSKALEALLDLQYNLVKLGGWVKVSQTNPLVDSVFTIARIKEYIHSCGKKSQDDHNEAHADQDEGGAKLKLGELLLNAGIITGEQVKEVIVLQEKVNKRIGQIILEKGWSTEKDVLPVLSKHFGIPYIKIAPGLYDHEVISRFEKNELLKYKILPLFYVNGVLTIATADPQDIVTIGEIETQQQCRIQTVLAATNDIMTHIEEAYADDLLTTDIELDLESDIELVEEKIVQDYDSIDKSASDSPVINLVNSIIQKGVKDCASDIHLECSRTVSRVRYRIDGVLYEAMTFRVDLHPIIVSRLKVMANLDISERRLPQDGRMQVYLHGRAIDIRFSSLPGMYGEKIVLRVLDKNQSILDIGRLGLTTENHALFKNLLDKSYGLILVTGPTGSGKTTSLYAAINYLNNTEKNTVTIEDPPEYQIESINQNEVKEKIGLTFARILKHVLRQDPDIIMVGEIRERETAEIAVQAALTGHLVLSTLHTNDSISAISRLIDMGVEPYMLSSALLGVVAQRLIRSICPACKTQFICPPELADRYHFDKSKKIYLAKGRGCQSCYDSGYSGRLPIHEILTSTEDLQKLIVKNPSKDQLTAFVRDNNINTLYDDGLARVLESKTTIDEIIRILNT